VEADFWRLAIAVALPEIYTGYFGGRHVRRALKNTLDVFVSLYIVSVQMTKPADPKLLRIDLSHSVPAYRQIADGLRALLVDGTFAPGDRLPTVRQLATDLAVHHNTVAQAYRLLADEGWLDLKRHRGVTVRERRAQRATAATQQNFLQRLRELTARAASDGLDSKTIARHLDLLSDELNQ
jgi:GntR family transcriptional regulator